MSVHLHNNVEFSANYVCRLFRITGVLKKRLTKSARNGIYGRKSVDKKNERRSDGNGERTLFTVAYSVLYYFPLSGRHKSVDFIWFLVVFLYKLRFGEVMFAPEG